MEASAKILAELPSELFNLRSQMRTEAHQLAQRWTNELIERWELPAMGSSVTPESRWLVTGHQPMLPHGGISEKTELLQHFLGQHQEYGGINVIMDTDESDGVPLLYPRGDPPQRTRAYCGEGEVPFCFAHTRPRPELQEIVAEVSEELRLAAPHAVSCFKTNARFFEYGGTSLVEWSAAVRRAWEGASRYLELPFSKLMASPSGREIMRWCLRNARDLHAVYNETLRTFRSDHRIENPANPFPNLKQGEDALELPCWLLRAESRSRSIVTWSPGGSDGFLTDAQGRRYEAERVLDSAQGDLLVPRGALISFILRIFLADVFIHGFGGARYDRYTDRLISAWLGIEATSFFAVTATRLLFREMAARIGWAETQESESRFIRFHPQRFLEAGFFSADLAEEVQQLSSRRQALVQQILALQRERRSSAKETRAAKVIDARMEELVRAAQREKSREISFLTEEARSAYTTREYPVIFMERVRRGEE